MTETTETTDASLTFRDLTLGYNDHPAVHHLNGTVKTGSLTAVVGANGSGKSTLMKGIVGVLKPMAGESLKMPGARIALRRLTDLVADEQHEPFRIGIAVAPLALAEECACPFYQGARIAAAGLQQNGIDMHEQVVDVGKALEECGIAALALAFAADEQALALGARAPPCSDRPPHPILGTAP